MIEFPVKKDKQAKFNNDNKFYNTQMSQLVMPEYGRNIQKMVEHCMNIEDRTERNRCARTIIEAMCEIKYKKDPAFLDNPEYDKVLWDHLALLSNFQLDVDYPYEIVKKEEFNQKPVPMNYPAQSNRTHLHYGVYTLELIKKCCLIEDERERTRLAIVIANVMKRQYFAYNKPTTNQKIFDDLYALSLGNIRLDPETPLVSDNVAIRGSITASQFYNTRINTTKRAIAKDAKATTKSKI